MEGKSVEISFEMENMAMPKRAWEEGACKNDTRENLNFFFNFAN